MFDARRLLKLLPHGLTLALMRPRIPARLEGRRFLVPVGADGGLQHLWWRRTWRTELVQRFFAPKAGEFVDVGANMGQTLVDVWVTHPDASYVGFEPNVACARFLLELVAANGLSRFRIVPSGLAARNGCHAFFRLRGVRTDQAGSIVQGLRPSQDYEIDYVSCLRFDDLVDTLQIRRLGFVKVDVEGAELEVLRGMEHSLRQDRPVVVCEVLLTDSKGDLEVSRRANAELMTLLKDIGYAVFQIDKTDDYGRVRSYRPTETFPSAYWSEANREMCDYLFMPQERVREVRLAETGKPDPEAAPEHERGPLGLER